jgi:Tol biopolymer transport system component/C-terminal processing protease CtpA/Prc
MSKKSIFTVFTLFLSLTLFSQNPLWLRYPSISPDGQTVAFSYKGDIFTVSANGGAAQQITTHTAYDYMPVWSTDGKTIAFASNRYGNFDIFTVAHNGGAVKRVTTFSGAETPYCFSSDGKYIVYGANIQAPSTSAAFPSNVMSQLYKIAIDGGQPEQILATPAVNVNFDKNGKFFIFQDRKGQENTWRKHHKSSVTRNIWSYNIANKQFTELINDDGEDTDPVLSADNQTVYFLSERNGTFNIFSFPLNNPKNINQLTTFKTHPVRFLSISRDNVLCFGYDGEIYTMKNDGKPQKLSVKIVEENRQDEMLALNSSGANTTTVSSDGKQTASVMRGDIFVSSVDYKYTKRITDNATADNSPSFSPDGKTLVFASEQSGTWNLCLAKINRKEETYFFNATLIDIEPVLQSQTTEYMHPQFSPDGKEIAFIQDRHKIAVYNIESKKVREITDGSGNPQTSGDINFEWSPDSKWIAFEYTPNRHDPYSDIGLVSAQGGKVTNLTNSGYTSGNPRWVMNGNAIIFLTERYGMRNHASWGSLDDAMIVFLNQKTFDKYRLGEDDYKLLQEEEKAKKKDIKKDDKSKDEKSDNKGKKSENDTVNNNIKVELDGIEDRILRITPNSSNMGDIMLTTDGDKLYYLSKFEKGYDLWSIEPRTRETKLEIKDAGNGTLILDKEGKALFLLGSKPQKITLAGNKKETISVSAQMEINLAQEREYMFNHVWLQEQKRFYRTDLHGVDWKQMKKDYLKFLPYINNNFDFSEMLSEMLGELNVSHTGSGYRPTPSNPDATAALGLLFRWNYGKDGLLVDEVIEKSPFDKADSKMKKGAVIEAINGEKIEKNKDFYPILNKLVGKNTLISFVTESGEKVEEVIKPISIGGQNDLLYKRWVRQREADVERLSNGQLGYVHIESMGDESFRSIYSDILGKFNNKKAIVIDTRFNGGGRLHEDLEVLFSGKKYFTQVIRGVESCDMPSRRWDKPSIMLVGEANYSNAHGSPWVYRHVGIGKLVGMPVPGTMTSVTWEYLQDPSIYFGIPIVGYELPNGSYLENQQLEPDYKIFNDYNKLMEGRDLQLEKAVEELLKTL